MKGELRDVGILSDIVPKFRYNLKSILQVIFLFLGYEILLISIFKLIALYFTCRHKDFDVFLKYWHLILWPVVLIFIITGSRLWKIRVLEKFGNVTLKKLVLTFIVTYIFQFFIYLFCVSDEFSWKNISIDFNQALTFNVISSLIFAPVLEELLFRGIIQEYLCRKNSFILSVVLASLLFSVHHLTFSQFVTAFLGGLYFGVLYYKTQSLTYSMVAHSYYNLLCFYMRFG